MTDAKPALEAARAILQEKPVGQHGLRTLLQRKGFTEEEIQEAVAAQDWDGQAVRLLQVIRAPEEETFTPPPELSSKMYAAGFDLSTVKKAIEEADFSSDLDFLLQTSMVKDASSKGKTIYLLLFGYPAAQVEAAMKRSATDDETLCLEAARELLTTGVSRRGLQHELMERGFPKDMARRTIRTLHPDWNLQAVLAAEEMQLSTTDAEEARDWLQDAGFTGNEAGAALREVSFGSYLAAERLVQNYLREFAISPEDLEDTLERAGFREETYADILAKTAAETDWTQTGAEAAALTVRMRDLKGGPKLIRKKLRKWGYSKSQIERTMKMLEDTDWPARALEDFEDMMQEEPSLQIISPASLRRILLEFGYDTKTADAALRISFGKLVDEKAAALRAVVFWRYPRGYAKVREDLENAGYAPETVEYVFDQIYYNWDEMAVLAAETLAADLLMHTGFFSPVFIKEELVTSQGFTSEQADNALRTADIDWQGVLLSMKDERPVDVESARGELLDLGFAPENVQRLVELWEALPETKPADV